MGMFDEIHFVGEASSKRVVCAAGHPLGGLQTKDLECQMGHYYVYDNRIFGKSPDPDQSSTLYFRAGPDLIGETREKFVKADINGTVAMYTTCHECDPVYFEDTGSWQGDLSNRSPWCQFVARFEGGLLVSIERDRVETRDDIRASLTAAGRVVVPDTDRVVQRELKLRRQQP